MSEHEVQLLNVPCYNQGTFDALCAYYTGAMMLAGLFPHYVPNFGRANRKKSASMSRDPLIRHYGQGNGDHRHILANWFHGGADIQEVVRILNRIMENDNRDTNFKHDGVYRGEHTFNKFVKNFNEGLPVMLSWDTEDYGCHAVLVIGYWLGKEKWLVVHDPGFGACDINWNSLNYQQKGRGRFQIGFCTRHSGFRPMKLITEQGHERVLQWIPDCKVWKPAYSP